MTLVYRYAGPDGEGIVRLPRGTGAAIGSEYCVHLLPGVETLGKALNAAHEGNIPLLLLTPYFRDVELKRAMPLFRAIPAEADVVIAVNDWGALLALHTLFPRLRLTIGRLLAGQKRCPRIPGSPHLTERGRTWHGEGIFSSRSAGRYLREMFGVAGYHVDSLEWGTLVPANLPGGAPSPEMYVHSPYAVVTVSDACPWIGGKSSAAVPSCARPCRDGSIVLREPSMGKEMILKGKARFVYASRSARCAEGGELGPVVLYEEIP